MPDRWLILSDDLTGANDCAVAFARRGLAASVAWGTEPPPDAVLAFDAESRDLAPAPAAARHRVLLEAHLRNGVAFYKKIDSTLRGQPAAELAGAVQLLRARGRGALCVMAPAFPATGRTTEAGCVRLNGQALEATTLWRRDHTYPTGDLVAMLAAVGLQVQAVALADVRAGSEAVMRRVYDAAEGGMDAVVCDAVVPGDLDIVARATLPLASRLFWTGSGGLALALAQVLAEAGVMSGVVSADPCPVAGGILLVVGSLAEASREAAAQLADQGVLLTVAIPPATLLAGPDGAAWQDAQRRIADALARGEDVLVELTADAHADLSKSAALARQLAALLQPVGPSLGALFATGGETALAILDALGVTGIRLVDEIEPGVPLGFMRGALTAPVVTKAGAFGDAGTLIRCLAHLRSLRRTETAT